MSDLLPENQRLADFISRAVVRIRAADDDDDNLRVHLEVWEKLDAAYVPQVRSNRIKVTQYHLGTIEPLVKQMERASGTSDLLHTSHTLVTALSALPGNETEIYIPRSVSRQPGDETEKWIPPGSHS